MLSDCCSHQLLDLNRSHRKIPLILRSRVCACIIYLYEIPSVVITPPRNNRVYWRNPLFQKREQKALPAPVFGFGVHTWVCLGADVLLFDGGRFKNANYAPHAGFMHGACCVHHYTLLVRLSARMQHAASRPLWIIIYCLHAQGRGGILHRERTIHTWHESTDMHVCIVQTALRVWQL